MYTQPVHICFGSHRGENKPPPTLPEPVSAHREWWPKGLFVMAPRIPLYERVFVSPHMQN